MATPGRPMDPTPSMVKGRSGKNVDSACAVCSARFRRGTKTTAEPSRAAARAQKVMVLPDPVGASTHVRVAPARRRTPSSSRASIWCSRSTTLGHHAAGSANAASSRSAGESASVGSMDVLMPSGTSQRMTWRHARQAPGWGRCGLKDPSRGRRGALSRRRTARGSTRTIAAACGGNHFASLRAPCRRALPLQLSPWEANPQEEAAQTSGHVPCCWPSPA